MNQFLNAGVWLLGLIRATLRPRPRQSYHEWADQHVHIPEESAPKYPGLMQSRRFPIMRGLFDLAQQARVHYVSLCASARVGKTLFSIVLLLYWIAERVGSVVWLEPSRSSAKKFVNDELEHFLRRCPPVWALAVVSKSKWTTLWKTFRGKILRIVASGAEADLHGFNAEAAFINERDRCRDRDGDASSADKIVARTRLFPHTRKIVENSTPGEGGEFSPIWRAFLRGSQHHCYLPCPHCSADAAKAGQARVVDPQEPLPVGWSPLSLESHLAGWQRLTFTPEKKLVPFDCDLQPVAPGTPKDAWPEEVTGQIRFEQFATYGERVSPHDPTKKEKIKTGYDVDAVETGATYQCARCHRDIEFVKLGWMLARYRWMTHHPAAPADRLSAHVWMGYSPTQLGGGWGLIAKEFLEGKRDLAALVTFHQMTLGVPFIRQGAAVKGEDLDRCIARTPIRYVKGQLPREAEFLTMTIDEQSPDQGMEFWYSIRAWGVLWDHPEQPTWNALIDWGRAVSREELLEIAGIKPDEQGHERRFTFTRADGTTRHYQVSCGLFDSGHHAERVYEFCLRQGTIFDPYKGAPQSHTRGMRIRISKVLEEQVDLWLCWSDFFAENLYYDCVKWGVSHGEPMHWWLPVDIDDDYRKQLTDEYKDHEGNWVTRTKTNHLGDTEKMHRVLVGTIEKLLDPIRTERAAALEKKEQGSKA